MVVDRLSILSPPQHHGGMGKAVSLSSTASRSNNRSHHASYFREADEQVVRLERGHVSAWGEMKAFVELLILWRVSFSFCTE